MINYETILSNYDDRLTLMQWLKKVEAALMAAALASVTITQPSDDTAVFNFVFADGTSVSSPSLNLPRGPQGEQGTQGEQGAQGVGVSNVTINSNSHLIVTLTNGVEIDAGYIETGSGIVVDTELSPTSTNPVENRVIYNVVTTAQNTISALGGRVTDVETDLTALGGRVTTEEGNLLALSQRVTTAEGAITTLQNDKLEEVTAADVDSESAASGQVLTADGNGGAAWQTPSGGGGASRGFKVTFELNPGASGTKTIPDYFDTDGVYHRGLINVSEGITRTIENVAYLLLRGDEYYMTHQEPYRKRFLIGNLTSTTGNYPITIEESISTDNYADNGVILIPLCDVTIGIGSSPF